MTVPDLLRKSKATIWALLILFSGLTVALPVLASTDLGYTWADVDGNKKEAEESSSEEVKESEKENGRHGIDSGNGLATIAGSQFAGYFNFWVLLIDLPDNYHRSGGSALYLLHQQLVFYH